MNILQNRNAILGVIVLVAVVGVVVVTGAFKSDKQKGSPTSKTETKQVSELAERELTFGGSSGRPTFSVKAPVGWSTAEDSRVDFLIGSLIGEKLPDGSNFTPNINFIISKHEIAATSIADYTSSWKEVMAKSYPSMRFLSDDIKKVGELDAYIMNIVQTRPDGVDVHQIQYMFWVDSDGVLAVVGSAPDLSWDKYEKVIKASIESVKVEKKAETSESSSSQKYSNEKFGITLDPPEGWVKEDVSEAGMQDEPLVAFFPQTGRNAQNINIVVEDLTAGPLTLDEYTESMLSSAKNQNKDINFLESKKVTFAGLPAYRIVYSIPSKGTKDMMLWTVRGNLAYVFMYDAQPQNFDEFISLAEKVAATVAIK